MRRQFLVSLAGEGGLQVVDRINRGLNGLYVSLVLATENCFEQGVDKQERPLTLPSGILIMRGFKTKSRSQPERREQFDPEDARRLLRWFDTIPVPAADSGFKFAQQV